jgi:hypothetical protein
VALAQFSLRVEDRYLGWADEDLNFVSEFIASDIDAQCLMETPFPLQRFNHTNVLYDLPDYHSTTYTYLFFFAMTDQNQAPAIRSLLCLVFSLIQKNLPSNKRIYALNIFRYVNKCQ